MTWGAFPRVWGWALRTLGKLLAALWELAVLSGEEMLKQSYS